MSLALQSGTEPGQGVRPDALIAFRTARRAFLQGRRIEMQELAVEVGVSRATLFRWVGGKDQLVSEIIWSIALPTFRQAVQDAGRRRGGQRIAARHGQLRDSGRSLRRRSWASCSANPSGRSDC